MKRQNVTVPTVTEKRCTKCNCIKLADQFSRAPANATGLKSWCIECTRKAIRLKRNEAYENTTKLMQNMRI